MKPCQIEYKKDCYTYYFYVVFIVQIKATKVIVATFHSYFEWTINTRYTVMMN